MKLYFGNAVTTATTLMTLALLGFIGYSAHHRAAIACWGRRSAAVLALGLAICCFAAARDGLDKTIQHAIDGSCAPGLFPLVSVPTIIGCIGADRHGRDCDADCKDAADPRDLVLRDVRRGRAEDSDGGNCANCPLERLK